MSSSAADAFEHIIRQQTTRELVPFLLELAKPDVVPVRQQTRRLKKELEEYRDLGKNTWGSPITFEQTVMLFLAGLATYSRKEALGRGFDLPWQLNNEHNPDPNTARYQQAWQTVLAHARPDWLTDWLMRRTRTNPWAVPAYQHLRALEAQGLIRYEPWMVAQAVAHVLMRYNWHRNQVKGGDIQGFDQRILGELRADATLLARDLPLLFDFDTLADSASTYTDAERRNVNWLGLLLQLAASGHLSRADLLTRSLLALRRDFRRPLLTWFKNVFLGLQPTAAELLARQAELTELLAHPLPLVANFALDQLKDLWLDPAFDLAPLLLYADGLVTRPDLKTGVRTLLGGFEKLLTRNPHLAPELGRLAAAALAHADAGVQERAAKLLARLLTPNKPALGEADATDLAASLLPYADLLAPAARTVLEPWLTAAAGHRAPETAQEPYQPHAGFVPELSAATAVAPVQDWHELLFLTGQVLRHDDPAALERWLDGLLRLHAQFPANYAGQLAPYVLQILPQLKGKTAAEAVAILAEPGATSGLSGLAEALVLSWAEQFARLRVARVPLRSQYQWPDPLADVVQARLALVEERLHRAQDVPLLSTPTHAPYWVAPRELVLRLLAHQAAHQTPHPTDLAVALARTAFAHPTEAAAAAALLPQLEYAGLRDLLGWFLGPPHQPLPLPAESAKSWLAKVAERLEEWRPAQPAFKPVSLAESMPWLWAVAARTKHPEAAWPELQGLTHSHYPGIAQPWQPAWGLGAKSNTYVERWKPGKPEKTDRWAELNIVVEAGPPPPSGLLLYSLHARVSLEKRYYGWQLGRDYPLVAALLPHCPAPLHWHLLRTSARTDNMGSEGRDVVSHALRGLLDAGPRLDEAATLVLAVGLTHYAPACRALALETLLATIEHGRLVPAALGGALSRLLAAGFVPVQRLSDQLAQARAVSPAIDSAVQQTVETLLLELPAVPPRNTRKLLDAYTDLAARTRHAAPAALQARALEWSQPARPKQTPRQKQP